MTPEKALEYDKQLALKKSIDGSKTVYRQSPFNAQRTFDIKVFENQFLGSGRWIRDMLIKMDTQRHSILHDSLENNKRIRARKDKSLMSKNIADMFEGGGDTFIN